MALVYSFCFWFSLRLGGVIIGIFTASQAVAFIIISCLASIYVENVKDILSNLLETMDLLYITDILEAVKLEPERYAVVSICLNSVHLLICSLFVYGALTFNSLMMLAFLVGELFRLVLVTALSVTWLLIIKRNTVDIGLLIGTSIGVGFILLGMFYLWVCAANLPILINELEREEQAATIAKLQLMLESTQPRGFRDYDPFNIFTTNISGNPDVYKNKLAVID